MLNDTGAPEHGKQQEVPAQMSGKGKASSASLKKNKKYSIHSARVFKQQGMIIGLFIFPSFWLLGLLKCSVLMVPYFIGNLCNCHVTRGKQQKECMQIHCVLPLMKTRAD